MSRDLIPAFLSAVRDRLNRQVLLKTSAWTLLAIGGLSLAWALGWRIPGYAAPRAGYLAILILCLTGGFLILRGSHRNDLDAALTADRLYGLKDALLSWLGFRSSDGDAYALQEKSLTRRLVTLDPAEVPIVVPRRQYAVGAVLTLAAALLAGLPHSAAVREKIALQELTSSRSAEVKKQLEEVIKELAKNLDEDEKKELDPNKLLEMARELKETKDQREAEKQIARFEQQLAKAMQGLEMRQDEAVLKLAADELSKSSLSDARQLGKQLDAKDFEAAKEAVEGMKPEAKQAMTPEELEKLRQNAAKTREMAKRMADGGRKREFGKTPKPGSNKDSKPSKAGDENQASDKGNDQQAMQDILEELDDQARDLDEKLEDGEVSDDDEAEAGELGEKMDGLSKRLGKMNSRQKARDKMKSLRGALGSARQFSQGQSQSLSLSQMMAQSDQNGGKQAGKGSVESRRDAKDDLKDNNNRVEVKGEANGDGPSQKSVESAESGTGIAGRAGVDRNRDFKRAMESMVRRDDVPEELKLGVREYFERVHETPEDPPKK